MDIQQNLIWQILAYNACYKMPLCNPKLTRKVNMQQTWSEVTAVRCIRSTRHDHFCFWLSIRELTKIEERKQFSIHHISLCFSHVCDNRYTMDKNRVQSSKEKKLWTNNLRNCNCNSKDRSEICTSELWRIQNKNDIAHPSFPYSIYTLAIADMFFLCQHISYKIQNRSKDTAKNWREKKHVACWKRHTVNTTKS